MNRYCRYPVLTLAILSVLASMYGRSSKSYLRKDEFLIDTGIVHVPAPGDQSVPSLAFDGSNYFLVWEDGRYGSGSINIYGARVNQQGVLLDSGGIAISVAVGDQRCPAIAFDGTNYCVVWQDDRNGTTDIYAIRIDHSGFIIDSTEIMVSSSGQALISPAIAFDGVNYLVVWETESFYGQQNDIHGARINQAGIVLDTIPITISAELNAQKSPSIAFDGTNYFVTWIDRRYDLGAIYGTRVSPAASVLDPQGIPICYDPPAQPVSPILIFGNSVYLVIWSISGDIRAARINLSGVVLDPFGFTISSASNSQYAPAIAFDGTNFLVTWTDMRNWVPLLTDIFGARVNQSGVVLDVSGIPISVGESYQKNPRMAFDGTNYFTLWSDGRNGYNVCGVRISQSGQVIDSTRIALATRVYWQRHSGVSFDGTDYFVAWTDYRNGSFYSIYGSRVSPAGIVLDTPALPISNLASSSYPSVASGDTIHFIVWSMNGDIYAARVSRSGQILDTSGIVIFSGPNAALYPCIAFGSANFLAVWNYDGDICGSRIGNDGVVIDSIPIPISIASGFQIYPRIAFDGANYFVVWADFRNDPYSMYSDIYATRISQTGVVLDPSGIPISATAHNQTSPSLSFGDTTYLVTWLDNRLGGDYDIYGARITLDGSVLDPSGIPITASAVNEGQPTLGFDDTDFIIVWHALDGDFSNEIHGARLSPSGAVIETLSISLEPGDQVLPAVVHGIDDQLLITYAGWTDSINAHPAYTMRIWGELYPCIGIEEDGESGSMVNGINIRAYPNPFNRSTDIRYYPHTNSKNLVLTIYDVSGRLVKEFAEPTSNVGRKSYITWDGTDQSNRRLPSGIYFLRFTAGDYTATDKLLLIR